MSIRLVLLIMHYIVDQNRKHHQDGFQVLYQQYIAHSSFTVKIHTRGPLCKRHQEQLHPRYVAKEEADSGADIQQITLNAPPPPKLNDVSEAIRIHLNQMNQKSQNTDCTTPGLHDPGNLEYSYSVYKYMYILYMLL